MKSAAKLSVLVCTALLIVFSSTSAVCAADVITEEPDAAEAAEIVTNDVPDETVTVDAPAPAEETAEEVQEEAAEAEISDSEEEVLSDEESADSVAKSPEKASEAAEKAAEEAPQESAEDTAAVPMHETFGTVYQRVKGGNGYADVSDLNISGEQSDQLFSFLCKYVASVSIAKDANGNVTYVFFNSAGDDAEEADTESLYQEIYKRLLNGNGFADISDMDISEEQEDALTDYLSSYSDSVVLLVDNGHIMYVMFDDGEEGCEDADAEDADAEAEAVSVKKAVISERSEISSAEPEEISVSDVDDDDEAEIKAVDLKDPGMPLANEQSPEEPVGALMGIALFVVAGIRHLIECL